MRLVEMLIDIVFPPRPSELVVRAMHDDSLPQLLSPSVISLGDLSAVGLLPYSNSEVQSCIIETKYHGNAQATTHLACTLHEYLLDLIADLRDLSSGSFVLVPVPLSSSRLRERGYNQTERIAREALQGLEAHLHLATDTLLRTRDTLPQTSLGGHARLRNVEGAFVAKGPCNRAHTYIVFDDVITTGATLSQAVRALKNAGATDVQALALAH
ncbi:MAG: hypothetical protein V4480_02610 [Patescibacteria group bacterium]